ncbi:MFS transporter [Paenibacillus etheri]
MRERFRLVNIDMLSRLSLCVVLLSTGMTLVWPINVVYMHDAFGRTASAAGLVLLFNNGASFVGNVLGGFIYDRWGGKTTVYAGIIGSASVVTAMGIVRDFYGYAALLTLLGFFGGLVYPVINAVAVSSSPGEELKAVNRIFVSHNIGMALGASLGGLIADMSIRALFFGNALLYVLFLVMFAAFIHEPITPGQAARSNRSGDGREVAHGSKFIIILCIAFAISWLCYSQWAAIVPLHSQANSISFRSYSMLWTINGALIMLSLPVKMRLLIRYPVTARGQVVIGSILFGLGLLTVGLSIHYSQFVVAMILMTLGEILVFPSVPAWALEKVGPGARGRVMGWIAASSTAGRMAGPFIGGILYENIGGKGMFAIMAVVCVAGICLYLIPDKLSDAQRVRTVSE